MAPFIYNTWFAMQLNASQTATVYIYDVIGAYGVEAKEFINELSEIPSSVKTINVRINSLGGSIAASLAIYDALRQESARRRVVCHVDGFAFCMASVVALAGNEVRMAKNALLMIRNPRAAARGNGEDVRHVADLLGKIKDTIIAAYSRSNCTREELAHLMDEETYFSAREALEDGFIDAIEDYSRAAAEALSFSGLDQFNIPASHLDRLQSEAAQPERSVTEQYHEICSIHSPGSKVRSEFFQKHKRELMR